MDDGAGGGKKPRAAPAPRADGRGFRAKRRAAKKLYIILLIYRRIGIP
jgi:hypothetical protein